MKTVAIADLLDLAAANPEIALAVAGVVVLLGGIAVIILSLSSRVAELEGRHNGLAEDVADIDSEYFDQQTAQWAAIRDTRKKVAQLGRRVKRLRDEKGRFVKKPKLHDAA